MTNSRSYHHRKVIDALRSADRSQHADLFKKIDEFTDDELISHMFRNARFDDDVVRGGRLNKVGVAILNFLYTSWKITLDHPLTMRQQLRFARACRLPYYYTDRVLISFEKEVGMWLALIQGDIDLMDNVLPEY